MLWLLGELIYFVGWVVGGIEWRLGMVKKIPEKYRR